MLYFVFKPTEEGGRVAFAETPHGKYYIEWDSEGELVSQEIDIFDATDGEQSVAGLDIPLSEARQVSGLSSLKHGFLGLLKASANVDVVNSEAIRKRRMICAGCDRKKGWKCTECGCLVAAKTKLKSESCPLDKW